MNIMLLSLLKSASTEKIFKALDNEVRFVGGCVRDALLNQQIKDTDLATTKLPEEVIKLLEKAGIRVIPTGLKHGTVTAVINKKNFEITTLRRDVSCDGRHADVEFTDDWEEDAARRDFTMNAMSVAYDGKLYDYFGGQNDLEKHLVCFVGDAGQRCEEDILRILRFFRFNAYYGDMPPDEDGLAACKKYAGKISGLSGERIQAEMIKLLAAENPADILAVMQDNGISQHILPELFDITGLKNLLLLEKRLKKAINPLLRLAVLIRDKDATLKLAKQWKLSNNDKDYLLKLTGSAFAVNPKAEIKKHNKNIRQAGRDIFSDRLLLEWVEDAGNDKYEAIYNHALNWEIPVFPVSGKDLQAIGIKPGKEMGDMLREAEIWWEEGEYKASKEEILTKVASYR